MKSMKWMVAGCVAVAMASVGCNKESSGGVSQPQSGHALRDAFNAHVSGATQEFTVNAGTGGTITGANGTIVVFQPNAFITAGGSPVVGTVSVKLVEALTIGDMIWLNKQTVGNDNGTSRLLRSGGELKLTATSAGAPLRVVPNSVWISVPDATPDPAMDLFMGRTMDDGNMIWDPVDSSNVTIVEDSIFNEPFYVFSTDSLGWINCDYFWNYPNTTMLEATIPSNQSIDSTLCWIAFPSENAVMNLIELNNSTFQTYQVVPVGMQAVVIGLYRYGTSYYSSFNNVTISNNMTVPMTFTATSLAQFQNDINGI